MKMQYRLSPQMKEVVERAEQAARDYRHKLVEPEDLLIGLVHLGEGEGGNFNLLSVLNVSYDTVIGVLEQRIQFGSEGALPDSLSLSMKANEILEKAESYANKAISPYYLLRALEETPGTLAYDILHHLNGHRELDDFEGESWRNGEGSDD